MVSGDDTLTIGSPLDYAGPNQELRAYLGLSDDDREEIVEEVEEWLRKLARP